MREGLPVPCSFTVLSLLLLLSWWQLLASVSMPRTSLIALSRRYQPAASEDSSEGCVPAPWWKALFRGSSFKCTQPFPLSSLHWE